MNNMWCLTLNIQECYHFSISSFKIIINMLLCILFLCKVLGIQCVLYTYDTSHIRSAIFQELNRHVYLLATLLASTILKQWLLNLTTQLAPLKSLCFIDTNHWSWTKAHRLQNSGVWPTDLLLQTSEEC